MDSRAITLATTNDDIFLSLPRDLIILLCTYLCGKDILNLILATRSFLPVYPLLAKRDDFPLRKLLGHATLGEWEATDLILNHAKPSPCLSSFLLSCRGTVFHANSKRHRGVHLSCWQTALINEELEEAEQLGMGMSEEEKRKQFMEVFPTGEMVKSNWDFAKAKELLLAVLGAVISDETINENNLDRMHDKTRAALNELYDYVKPSREHKTGLVFDANFYLEALQQYESNFDKFKNWHRRSFWCVRVEEHLAALLGTGYLRPHAQGIGNTLTRGGCVLADGSSYFSFRRRDSQVAGVHFFVTYCGWLERVAAGGGPGARGGQARPPHVESFSNLISGKKEASGKLMQRYSRQQHPSKCLVC